MLCESYCFCGSHLTLLAVEVQCENSPQTVHKQRRVAVFLNNFIYTCSRWGWEGVVHLLQFADLCSE